MILFIPILTYWYEWQELEKINLKIGAETYSWDFFYRELKKRIDEKCNKKNQERLDCHIYYYQSLDNFLSKNINSEKFTEKRKELFWKIHEIVKYGLTTSIFLKNYTDWEEKHYTK